MTSPGPSTRAMLARLSSRNMTPVSSLRGCAYKYATNSSQAHMHWLVTTRRGYPAVQPVAYILLFNRRISLKAKSFRIHVSVCRDFHHAVAFDASS